MAAVTAVALRANALAMATVMLREKNKTKASIY
jgi:hypothetical protein